MKKLSILIVTLLATVSVLSSCEEKGLLTNANDVSYISFEKNMTVDTTAVCFLFYNEGEDAQIKLKVSVSGKMQDKDLEFTVSVDPTRTTLPASQYELPERCVIKAGELTGEVPVALKYYDKLEKEIQFLALKVDEAGEVRQGSLLYTRAIISATNKLFKPVWWSRNDGDANAPWNIVESNYLGQYSQKKYLMFLEELKVDGVVFDGTDMLVLRKYALRLKNTIKTHNETYPDDPMVDENGPMIIKVPG